METQKPGINLMKQPRAAYLRSILQRVVAESYVGFFAPMIPHALSAETFRFGIHVKNKKMAVCLSGIAFKRFVADIFLSLQRIGTDIAFRSLRHWDASHGPPCVTTTRSGLGNQAALHFFKHCRCSTPPTKNLRQFLIFVLQACTTPQQL